MTKVCVTGGAGFIGSNLVRECLERDYQVNVIDDFSTGRRKNLEAVREDVEIFEGDVRDPGLVESALSGVEVVFHQAAMPSVPRSMDSPTDTTDVTFMGTVNLFEQAADLSVKRIVYASSSAVYGNQPGFPRHEDMETSPESPYAAAKAACEQFGQVFSKNFPVETVGLRYFNVFGPFQDPESEYAAVVPSFVSAVLADEKPVIYGDGKQSRDFTFVQDVVDANLAAAQKGRGGEVYNVARLDSTTVNELLELIKDVVGSSVEPRHDPPRPGDVRKSYGANSKLEEDTGFSPGYTVREGLENTVGWYQQNREFW